jgi:hypothetical protein
MRANEFINENKKASMRPSMKKSGLHAKHYGNNDTYYDMYRFGVAIAGGETAPNGGPAGHSPTVWMRNPEEAEIIRVAEKVTGMKGTKIIPQGNSEEMPTVGKISPVAKSKRNKYGV